MLLLEGTSLKHCVQERQLLDIDELKVQGHQRIGLVGTNRFLYKNVRN